MSNPWTISGERIELSRPTQSWETVGDPDVNEAPTILQKDGAIHIIYSASGSWTDDYCLGRLTNTDGDVLNPASWTKTGPVFSKTSKAYGPGHASFTKSPDGEENWMVYHAKEVAGASLDKRSVRMQPFTWNGNVPVFGTPAAFGTYLPEPSGTVGVQRYEAEQAVLTNCVPVSYAGASNGQVVGYINETDSAVEFTVDMAKTGNYLLNVMYGNGMGITSTHNVSVNGRSAGAVSYPAYGWGVFGTAKLVVRLNAGVNTLKFTKGVQYAEIDAVELVWLNQDSSSVAAWESLNYRNSFMRHYAGFGRMDQNVSPVEDMLWKMVPGLADSSGVSFASTNYPGHYLRHANYRLWKDAYDGSPLFDSDATFHMRPGLADPEGTSLESHNYPGYYIRHASGLLRIDQMGTGLDRQDATFLMWDVANPQCP